MLGRVMNCLEHVFIHDGQGHPIYFQTFNGHADLGKNTLKMMDTLTEYLEATTTLEGQFTVNRILIMDAAGNGVKTLRELSSSDSGYYYPQVHVKLISGIFLLISSILFNTTFTFRFALLLIRESVLLNSYSFRHCLYVSLDTEESMPKMSILKLSFSSGGLAPKTLNM